MSSISMARTNVLSDQDNIKTTAAEPSAEPRKAIKRIPYLESEMRQK